MHGCGLSTGEHGQPTSDHTPQEERLSPLQQILNTSSPSGRWNMWAPHPSAYYFWFRPSPNVSAQLEFSKQFCIYLPFLALLSRSMSLFNITLLLTEDIPVPLFRTAQLCIINNLGFLLVQQSVYRFLILGEMFLRVFWHAMLQPRAPQLLALCVWNGPFPLCFQGVSLFLVCTGLKAIRAGVGAVSREEQLLLRAALFRLCCFNLPSSHWNRLNW